MPAVRRPTRCAGQSIDHHESARILSGLAKDLLGLRGIKPGQLLKVTDHNIARFTVIDRSGIGDVHSGDANRLIGGLAVALAKCSQCVTRYVGCLRTVRVFTGVDANVC